MGENITKRKYQDTAKRGGKKENIREMFSCVLFSFVYPRLIKASYIVFKFIPFYVVLTWFSFKLFSGIFYPKMNKEF